MAWTKPYLGIQHFKGPREVRVQITLTDRGCCAEVYRLDLGSLHPFTRTHHAVRDTVEEVKDIGEAWARGDYSAPERLP